MSNSIFPFVFKINILWKIISIKFDFELSVHKYRLSEFSNRFSSSIVHILMKKIFSIIIKELFKYLCSFNSNKCLFNIKI
jgi:hypothetical protein